MTQALKADYPFAAPSWMANIGTNATLQPFHADLIRVSPFTNVGTFSPSSTANTGPTHATASNALHYLSDGIRNSSPIQAEFVRRRDGAGGANAMMSWMYVDARPYAYNDLTAQWTFCVSKLEAPSATSLSAGGGSNGQFVSGGAVITAGSTISGASVSYSPAGPMGVGYRIDDPDVPNSAITGWDGWLVGVRVRGSHIALSSIGSFTIDTAVMQWADGYWFHIVPSGLSSNADLTIKLFRTTSAAQNGTGTTQRLVAEQVIPNGVSFMNLGAPVTVKVAVNTVGGDPTFDLSLFPFDGVETQMFAASQPGTLSTPAGSATIASDGTITDSAAGKITSQGTIAFGGYSDRTRTVGQNTVNVREGLVAVESYQTSSASATRWRDEFSRTSIHTDSFLTGAVLRCTDQFGYEGGLLDSMWTFGSNANIETTFDDVPPALRRTATGATVLSPQAVAYLTHDGTANNLVDGERDYIYLRPSDRDDSHHRVIDFRPGLAAAGTDQFFRFGLMARGSIGAGGGAYFKRGIACWIEASTSAAGALTSFTVNLGYRVRANGGDAAAEPGVYTKIATAAYTTSPALFDGSFHTLEFDAHIFPDASSAGAPVIYRAKLDGVNVTFTAVAGSSVTILASTDTVIDFASQIPSGRTEGFFFGSFQPQSTGWPDWQVRDYEQLTLTTSAGGTLPDQQASIVITGQEANAFGNLHNFLEPDWEFEEMVTAPAWQHAYDSGHRQSRSRWPGTKRSWKFEKRAVSTLESDTIISFWNNHDGGEIPFNWKPIGYAASFVARFREDSLSISEDGPGSSSVSFIVDEV